MAEEEGAIGFAEFGHNCIITTISNCSCSMNFYNGFQPQPLMTFKQALFGKFTGFYLVDIQPWPGPATWAGQAQVSVAAALERTTTTQTRLGLQAVKGMFFMLLAHKSSYLCI